MHHHAFAVEGEGTVSGVVVELIGDAKLSRRQVLAHAADGAHRDDPLHAELLEAVNVGAVVQLGRHETVAAAMTRQEEDLHPAQVPSHVDIRGIAERRRHRHLLGL
jgi:hypothetical protein